MRCGYDARASACYATIAFRQTCPGHRRNKDFKELKDFKDLKEGTRRIPDKDLKEIEEGGVGRGRGRGARRIGFPR